MGLEWRLTKCERIFGAGMCVFFVDLLQSKDLQAHLTFLLVLIFYNFVVDCRKNGTNMFCIASGNSSSVGKLHMAFREANEGEPGSRNICENVGGSSCY
jgi:hypothetical protein